jgi:hypothetical protein
MAANKTGSLNERDAKMSAAFLKTPLFAALAGFAVLTLGQASGLSDQQRAAGVDQRGDQGMGFSHTLTGHHFRLLRDGGAIEVEANRADGEASKAAIREHMKMIAGMFSRGDFSLPMFIHDTVPPGIEVMKRLKGQITYTEQNTAQGAQVRIITKNPDALAAVHEFLRFQIKDHRTGDPVTIARTRR